MSIVAMSCSTEQEPEIIVYRDTVVNTRLNHYDKVPAAWIKLVGKDNKNYIRIDYHKADKPLLYMFKFKFDVVGDFAGENILRCQVAIIRKTDPLHPEYIWAYNGIITPNTTVDFIFTKRDQLQDGDQIGLVLVYDGYHLLDHVLGNVSTDITAYLDNQ